MTRIPACIPLFHLTTLFKKINTLYSIFHEVITCIKVTFEQHNNTSTLFLKTASYNYIANEHQ